MKRFLSRTAGFAVVALILFGLLMKISRQYPVSGRDKQFMDQIRGMVGRIYSAEAANMEALVVGSSHGMSLKLAGSI